MSRVLSTVKREIPRDVANPFGQRHDGGSPATDFLRIPMTAYGSAQLAASFRTVRGNTIKIAEEIPEDQYGFVAAPGFRPIGELLAHIAIQPELWYDMHGVKRLTTIAGYDFPAIITRLATNESHPRSKAELIELLRDEGEKMATWLESLSDDYLAEQMSDFTGTTSKSRLEGLLSIKEHEMHHRGQLMLIERMLGIVPHLTRAMAERAAAARRQREAAGAST
jgi:uncharacterized damage-inducible protein DinB